MPMGKFLKDEWKGKSSILILGVIVLAAGLYFLFQKKEESSFFAGSQDLLAGMDVLEESKEAEEKLNTEPVVMKVDVKGEVKKPGVYIVKEGDRVIDVVEDAGGFTEEADINQINLSEILTDQMVVFVPKIGEDIVPVSGISPGAGEKNGKVNINKADATALETLPGIGPSKAQAIIEYRETNGKFQSIEELMNISGIGEKTFEKLKEHITVQ